jgi:hypothetical protein
VGVGVCAATAASNAIMEVAGMASTKRPEQYFLFSETHLHALPVCLKLKACHFC